jgi:hypothetical protein
MRRWKSVRTIDFVPQKLIHKYGGANDQLSMKYKFLDRWHVRSLFKHTDNPLVREKIRSMCEGLQKAALKYGDTKLLDECAVWMLRLDEVCGESC